jgi:hypothetical protein
MSQRLQDQSVTGVHVPHMRAALASVTQSGSGATRPRRSRNVGRAALVNHGDIQQGGTMRRGDLNVGVSPLNACRCNTTGSVTGPSARIAARASRDAAEGFFPVIMPALAQAIATHRVVDVAALGMTTAKARGYGDTWHGASGAKAVVATVDEITIRRGRGMC